MSLSREEAHQLVEEIFNKAETKESSPELLAQEALEALEALEAVETARVLPEGKRVVRTKASGDRVYLLDEVKKTRQWVTNPDVLDSLGFELGDVGEVDEEEMLKYQMGPALYRRVDEA